MKHTRKNNHKDKRKHKPQPSCRGNGDCPYCELGRQHKNKRRASQAGEPK